MIQLFNGAIPLIALKMTAYKVGDQFALTFVKVLDELTYGLVEEDEPISEPTDRAFWETKRGTKETFSPRMSCSNWSRKSNPKPC